MSDPLPLKWYRRDEDGQLLYGALFGPSDVARIEQEARTLARTQTLDEATTAIEDMPFVSDEFGEALVHRDDALRALSRLGERE